MGADGLTASINAGVAKDAFGYTLNYHANDYKPIDGLKWSPVTQRFEAVIAGSDLNAERYDLFNGNISSMVTTIMEPKVYTIAANEYPTILPQGTAYKYDQLNRLLEMKAYTNLDMNTSSSTFNTWLSGSAYSGSYHNTFKYDANGNILGQLRANQSGTVIDSLTYKYAKDALGKMRQNRLYDVNDNVTATAFADDIDDQGVFNASTLSGANYNYDEIGNLIKDGQEQIDKITWTVYGKIKTITRATGSLRSDLEFNYDASGNRISKVEKPRDASGVKPASEWITTYYSRDAQGNVMTIYKHTPVTAGTSFKVIERNIYGSSRLGSDYTEVELVSVLPTANPYTKTLGNKHYEGSNHLGNVLVSFSDRKIPRDNNSDGIIDYFESDVLSSTDFSPFGTILDNRNFGNSPRVGFNGKEKDDEIKGIGNSLDFGERIYDSRLGRFLSVDPDEIKYPSSSPYTFASNNPIKLIDVDGKGHGDPSAKHERKLEKYKSKHQTELFGLNAQQIEDRFANHQGTFLGKYGRMNKDTKWYRNWLSLSNQTSRVTAFPLSTIQTVKIDQPIGGAGTQKDGDVPFNRGTVKVYFNGGATPSNPYDLNYTITDEKGNEIVNKTFTNVTRDGYINEDIPFSKTTKNVTITVTATMKNSGAEDKSFAWGTSFTPDKKDLAPSEEKPNAKPKYKLKK